MISSLRITNFALISELELSLDKGFSVITGETGSGKSILLGALELLLGERADFSVIGPDSEKAIVEATAELSEYIGIQSLFEQYDLDFEHQTIIRREISQSGRSRAFINDIPVQLNVLRALTEKLINIHSQYNTLELKNKSVQLNMLDTLAGLTDECHSYSKLFADYQIKILTLQKLKEELSSLLRQKDYNLFQLNELIELDLDKTDFASLEKEFTLAENSETIVQSLDTLIHGLNGERGILEVGGKIRVELDRLKNIDPKLDELNERFQSSIIELKELSSDAERYIGSMEIDPRKKLEIQEKLDKYNHALRKHQVITQAELIGLSNQFSSEIEGVDQLELKITSLENEVENLKSKVVSAAEKLHNERVLASGKIEKQITELLAELKLIDTLLKFQLDKKELGANGCSAISIQFSANKGIEPVPIEKAASGGELSRVMLALQKLVSEKKQMPTVLFDEIDTGVSGDVAQKIGSLLQRMGKHMQLIAITHLPQVAAKADHHFKVEKYDRNTRTVSAVRVLNEVQHIEEVARLMSGEIITDAAISNAKALMNS